MAKMYDSLPYLGVVARYDGSSTAEKYSVSVSFWLLLISEVLMHMI